MKKVFYLLFLITFFSGFSQNKATTRLRYADDFKNGLSNWVTEFEEPATSSIQIVDSKMDVITSIGATIWFNQKLSGNIMITFMVRIIDAGDPYDRVSDMNAIWMATDPANENIFLRDGEFNSYNDMKLYYAGVGGHYNKFTRFRKYHDDGNKPILKEYTDEAHLLKGNTDYRIKIVVNNGQIQYFRNDILFWDFQDETPYTEGYFGFRTTISHQQFSNFKVFQL